MSSRPLTKRINLFTTENKGKTAYNLDDLEKSILDENDWNDLSKEENVREWDVYDEGSEHEALNE